MFMKIFVPIFFIPVFLMACKTSIESSELPYNWKNVQIVGGGFVDGIVFHPSEPDLRYARTDMGGAYRWNDDEKLWIPLLDWVSYEDHNLMGIESIALNPNNPDDLFLACGTYTNSQTPNGAILISANRGRTFNRIDVPFKFGGNENGRGNGERMAVDPLCEDVIYLGTRLNGLWRSINKGLEWEQVTSFPDVSEFDDTVDPRTRRRLGGSGVVFVLFDEKAGIAGSPSSIIYVGVSLMGRENLFVSHDAGEKWKAVEGHPQGYRPTQAVLAEDGFLYVTYGDNPGPERMTNGAVWRYNTSTGIWNDITPCRPDESKNHLFGYASVSVDAANPKHVIVSSFYRPGSLGGDEIFRSLDGGDSWLSVFASGKKFDYSLAPYVAHTPVHWMFDIEINPFNPDHVIFTTGYGGHETFNFSDAGSGKPVVWHIMARGIEETVALELHSPQEGAQLLTAIGDYCGFAHHNLDNSVPHGCFENPHFSNTDGITTAELNPALVVRVGRASHHLGGVHIGYSTDFGKSWQPCLTSPSSTSMLGHIAVSANGESWVWTPARERPHFSNNMGASWTIIENLPENTRVIADKVNSTQFYAMSLFEGYLYISEDGGRTFEQKPLKLPDGLPIPGNRGDIRGGQDRLYATPGYEGHLWLAAFDGLYFSADYGGTWNTVPEVSEMHGFGFGKAAPDSDFPALFMIGVVDGIRGVFRSDDKARRWIRINDDNNQWGLLLHITGDPKKYGRVYVGTHGRGVFYGDLVR
jgi:hypothetical protein